MDIKCLEAVIAEMKPLLDGQDFKQSGDIFKNENKAVKVEYNDESKMFVLKLADVTDGEVGEFADVTSWLFEDDQTAKDAAAVGVDFADTLRGQLGLKKNVRPTVGAVALPTAEKGDVMTVTALTQKLLAIFPEFKDDYKESVAKYGKFLHQEFFMAKFVPAIKEMLANKNANRKPIKKLFDMFAEMYVEGDGETVDQVVAIIAAAVYENEEFIAVFKDNTEGKDHMQRSVIELLAFIKKNKKLRAALIK